jgi:O-antigen/teichoic acid export membrane protein
MSQEPEIDSLKKRYFFKLSANLINMPIAILPATIVPRMLGPSEYGNYIYVIYIFMQAANILTSGNNYLVTRLAEDRFDHGIKRFYIHFLAIGACFLFVMTLLLFATGMDHYVFPNLDSRYALVALFLVICLSYSQLLNAEIDVYALTVQGETVNLFINFISVLFLSVFYWRKWHNLAAVFAYRYIAVMLLLIAFIIVLRKKNIVIYPLQKNSSWKTQQYTKQFLDYSMPLYIYSLIVLAASCLNRWILQVFGGSIQQGYFGISTQLSTFVIAFSAALTPLLIREFSVCMGKNDMGSIAVQFKRFTPMLYSLAAYFCVFLVFQVKKLVLIIGGSKYAGATVPAAIMCLYPLFYTTNNIIYSVLYSTKNTRTFVNVGSILNMAMLPVYYLVLAPNAYFGLNLGAAGFAIVFVVGTFISYNIYLRHCTRILGISFSALFYHQFYSVAIFGVLAGLSVYCTSKALHNILLSFIVSGMAYTLGTIIMMAIFPALFQVSIKEIMMLMKIRQCSNSG